MAEQRPQYDPDCYLCPGNRRTSGEHNQKYDHTFVFDNDFAALVRDEEVNSFTNDDLFKVENQRGLCRVMCFSPRHDLTVADMSTAELTQVVQTWSEQVAELGAMDFIQHVQVFENKGAMMGCSNPHPHCQIWASENIPHGPKRRLINQANYARSHAGDLLGDYLARERELGERVVCENEHFTALVPFWATWPFEVSVISRRRCSGFTELNSDERAALADIMRRICSRYDNLFACSFPYSMGFYGAPSDGQPHQSYRFHAEYYPPLLRSATVKKFQVGYELSADPQRDLTPEQAAIRLREASEQPRLRS